MRRSEVKSFVNKSRAGGLTVKVKRNVTNKFTSASIFFPSLFYIKQISLTSRFYRIRKKTILEKIKVLIKLILIDVHI